MLTDTYERVSCQRIRVDRAKRQRTELNLDPGLRESIRMRGGYNPIIITRDLWLVAGERRLATSIELGLPDIPVRFTDDLSEDEYRVIELEENMKRSDLIWQDRVKAIAQIHSIYRS